MYRKSINYSLTNNLNRADGQEFGSAVAYTPRMGYLIGDSAAGKVYRYGLNPVSKQFDEDTGDRLTESTSFGTAIAYSNNLFVISEPETTSTTSTLRIYTLNDSVLSDDIIPLQSFTSSVSSGTSLAISNDQNYIFAGNPSNNSVQVYNRQHIPLTAGYFNVGETYEITSVGTTDFTVLGAIENKVGIIFNATGIGTGTGTANQISYEALSDIDGTLAPVNAIAGDKFGFSVSCDSNGDTISIGAPETKSPTNKTNWGKNFVFSRLVQNIESQYTAIPNQPQQYPLAWTTLFLNRNATAVSSNVITFTGTAIDATITNTPVVFNEGGNYGDTGITPNQVYYMQYVGAQTFSLKESRSTNTVITLTDDTVAFNILPQTEPLLVSVNGTVVDDNNYAVGGGTSDFRYFGNIRAGDIITISSRKMQWVQTMVSYADDRVGVFMGYDSDMTSYGSEILIGAPGEIRINGEEQTDGTVYRYTNGGGKYGTVIGTSDCSLTTDRKLLINGYLVELPSGGNATSVANLINQYGITNVTASASDGKLIISIINASLALVNEKLLLQAPDTDTFTELGLSIYTETQTINAPHNVSRTLFGNTIKFNESDSVVISAPVSTRFLGTTFDFIDDENLDNDTIFDNNATRWVDTWDNAGALYMYDYLANYNGSITDPGKFAYAQNLNSQEQTYGFEPQYATALDFTDNQVVIGTPNLSVGDLEGQITLFQNSGTARDWKFIDKLHLL